MIGAVRVDRSRRAQIAVPNNCSPGTSILKYRPLAYFYMWAQNYVLEKTKTPVFLCEFNYWQPALVKTPGKLS
jgi:hypothetical protein